MEWYVAASILAGGVLVLLFLGLPVAAALGGISLVLLIAKAGLNHTFFVMGKEFKDYWSNYDLLAVPLFIYMGYLLFASGAAANVFDVASKWLRRLPGGVAMSTIGAGAVFATMTGSSVGSVATFSVVALPEMVKRGYSKRLSAGTIASAGGLAHLIPPSVVAVFYAGTLTLSIGRQFMASFFPGLLVVSLYALIIVLWVKVFNPAAAPVEPSVSWKERLLSLYKIWPALVIILAVLVTIYTGVATVTEAAGLGTLAALVMALASKRFSRHVFRQTLADSLKTSAFIMFLAVAGKFLSWVLTYYMIPQNLVRVVVESGMSGYMFIVITQLIYLVLGCFIDAFGMIVITMPIYYPILLALGFDPYWFGVLLFINIEVALQTPPFGISLYIIRGVTPQISLADIMWGAFIFDIAELAAIGIVMAFPAIALWLPSTMMKG